MREALRSACRLARLSDRRHRDYDRINVKEVDRE
jgi:hypothetical protein